MPWGPGGKVGLEAERTSWKEEEWLEGEAKASWRARCGRDVELLYYVSLVRYGGRWPSSLLRSEDERNSHSINGAVSRCLRTGCRIHFDQRRGGATG